MLSAGDIEAVALLNHEVRSMEFKSAAKRTDRHFFARVARACLALGNIRDGGNVVIGIDDAHIDALLPGLNPEELNSWLDYDEVSRGLAEYADPPLSLEVGEAALRSGVRVAIIEVNEFSEVPHLCAKDYNFNGRQVTRRGALYVRSRRVPESSEIATLADMREVIGLATEKGIREYVATAERAGVTLGTQATAAAETGKADPAAYRQQRDEAWE